MKNSVTNVLSLVILSSLLLVSYQNCGDVGGSSLGSFYDYEGVNSQGSLNEVPDSFDLQLEIRNASYNKTLGKIILELACSGSTYSMHQINITIRLNSYNQALSLYSNNGSFNCSPSKDIESISSNSVEFSPLPGYQDFQSYNIDAQLFGYYEGALDTNANSAKDSAIIPQGVISPESYNASFYTGSLIYLSSVNDYVSSNLPAPYTNNNSEGYKKMKLSWEIYPNGSSLDSEFYEVFTILNEPESARMFNAAIRPIKSNGKIVNAQFGLDFPGWNGSSLQITNSDIDVENLFNSGSRIKYEYIVDCSSGGCYSQVTVRQSSSGKIILAINGVPSPQGRNLAREGLRLIAGRHDSKSLYPNEPSGWGYKNITVCLQSFDTNQPSCN